jgi:hypothetical protein
MMKMNFAVLFVIDHFYILLMPVGVADRGVPFVFLLLLLLTKKRQNNLIQAINEFVSYIYFY